MVKVMKFGGGCGRNGQSLEKVIEIIAADDSRRVITGSAPGELYGRPKVTDDLKRLGEKAYNEGTIDDAVLDRVERRFLEIASHLSVSEDVLDKHLDALHHSLSVRPDIHKDGELYGADARIHEARFIDSVMRYGELIQFSILVQALINNKIKAQLYLPEDAGIVTNSNFGNAKLMAPSYKRITKALTEALKEKRTKVLIPGFYGVDKHGSYTTFPRGGSDLTGSILARAVSADLYENFTHVNGVNRIDPNVFPPEERGSIEVIRQMNFDEMEQLGYTGSGVLLFDAVLPLVGRDENDLGIKLQIRNFAKLDDEGTLIHGNGKGIYKGITGISRENCYVISVKKRGIRDVGGYGATLLRAVSRAGISYKYSFDAINEFTVVLAESEKERIGALEDSIKRSRKLSPDNVEVYHWGIIGVVAEGMSYQKGISKDLISFLSGENINILRLNQGSERCILFFVDKKDVDAGAKLLYQKSIAEHQRLPPERYNLQ